MVISRRSGLSLDWEMSVESRVSCACWFKYGPSSPFVMRAPEQARNQKCTVTAEPSICWARAAAWALAASRERWHVG